MGKLAADRFTLLQVMRRHCLVYVTMSDWIAIQPSHFVVLNLDLGFPTLRSS